MRILTIFADIPQHTQLVELDGERYSMTLTWRERTAAWYLDLATEDGDDILLGVRLEPGCDVLVHADRLLAPSGKLFVVDAGGCGQAATRSTVGIRASGPPAATLRAGEAVTDTLGQRWIVTETTMKPAGTTIYLTLTAEDPGAVEAEPATVTVDPWAGVNVTNPGRAVVGQERLALLRYDLGVSALLIYVPEDEVPDPTPGSWSASTEYLESSIVLEGGRYYACTVGGTSGPSEPSWPMATGGQVEDGEATWQCVGASDDPVSVTVV